MATVPRALTESRLSKTPRYPRTSAKNPLSNVHVETDGEVLQCFMTLHQVQLREAPSSFYIVSPQGRPRFQQEKTVPANRGRRGSRRVDSFSEA